MKFITGLLDNIKSKGRYGDTELRIVNNEVSHVNEDEANLIDTYGLLGEVVTQGIGAGTINPNTGLREYHEGSWRTGFVAHPYHHPNWWVGENSLVSDAEDVIEDIKDYTVINVVEPLEDFAEDYWEDPVDTVKDTVSNWFDGDGGYYDGGTDDGGARGLSPQEKFQQFHTGHDLNTLTIEGKEIDYSRSKLAEFINPETNQLKDPGGLVRYIRTMNPTLARDVPGLDDEELIQWFQRMAPNFFESMGEVQDVRKQFTSDASGLIEKAGAKRMQMDFSEGLSGITRFGDTNRKIGEGLYKDIRSLEAKKDKDIETLYDEDLAEGADFIYGLTLPDSPYYTKPLTPEEFKQRDWGGGTGDGGFRY
tara:strand:+ start:1220 stop:2311 length:1092 start_codon:yes stop_codon:yes gene_type:complete